MPVGSPTRTSATCGRWARGSGSSTSSACRCGSPSACGSAPCCSPPVPACCGSCAASSIPGSRWPPRSSTCSPRTSCTTASGCRCCCCRGRDSRGWSGSPPGPPGAHVEGTGAVRPAHRHHRRHQRHLDHPGRAGPDPVAALHHLPAPQRRHRRRGAPRTGPPGRRRGPPHRRAECPHQRLVDRRPAHPGRLRPPRARVHRDLQDGRRLECGPGDAARLRPLVLLRLGPTRGLGPTIGHLHHQPVGARPELRRARPRPGRPGTGALPAPDLLPDHHRRRTAGRGRRPPVGRPVGARRDLQGLHPHRGGPGAALHTACAAADGARPRRRLRRRGRRGGLPRHPMVGRGPRPSRPLRPATLPGRRHPPAGRRRHGCWHPPWS